MAELRKAVAWFEGKAQPSGRITSGAATEGALVFPYHAHALHFLACACDVDDDGPRRARLAKVIEKGVAFAVEHQTSRGGWGFVARAENADYDSTRNTGIVLDALLAARKAGFAVPDQTTARAAKYFARVTNTEGGVIYALFSGSETRPRSNDGQPMMSTLAATCALASGARDGNLRLWVANAHATTPEPDAATIRAGGLSAMSQQYYRARVAFGPGETGAEKLDPGARGARWSAHRAKLHRELIALQDKAGRWTEPIYGPEYMTALALVTLQLDNQYLTAFAR
ncbi:MAG: hypothetical protein FJ304_13505 [Planctomycetes bacterium]|nr:hypothetical protein [Planctomycetota bacterium]